MNVCPSGGMPTAAARPDPAVLRKVIVGASIGNAVEWFDFAIYGFLATILATNFFPSEDPTAGLLKVAGDRRIAHLHVMTASIPRWHQQIAFRDALRADSALAADYAALKHALAQRHSDDRSAYSAAKESFIQAVLDPETA